jgi:leucyl/phenylalanyl-tRNA--protein transferase
MPLTFPPPTAARDDLDGLLLLGGQPTVENLVAAYAQGIFPWPVPGWPLAWFCPPRRG